MEENERQAEARLDWERKVLRNFFTGERLKNIPAAAKKRDVVLRWLAERFEAGARYSERQVNEILARHYPDFASLRRDHGIYWRTDEPDL